MSDSDASYDEYYASDDFDAMSGSDADEDLVLDEETFGDVAAGEDETPAVAFRSLDAAEVRERQRDAVARVTAVLQIPPESAAPLLRAHKWNVNHLNDAWFADEADTRAKAGLRRSSSDRAMDDDDDVVEPSTTRRRTRRARCVSRGSRLCVRVRTERTAGADTTSASVVGPGTSRRRWTTARRVSTRAVRA